MDDHRAIEPDALSTPERPWSHGILPTGRPLYVAGQTSVDADGNVQHPDDLEKQLELSLENLGRVLDAAGGTMADVADVTIYVTDMDTWQSADVGDVRYDYFDAPYPSSTLVEVSGLARPGLGVEVKAVAYVEE